jgi:indolepyruvate ferredoxin oxidoreductase beta subunit
MKGVEEINIVLAGVGGQGTIVMSEVLGRAAVMEGIKVRGSEVLGMAQRGGSVVSFLRLGGAVHGPMVPEAKADVMVAMEPSEALRNIRYLSKNTMVLLSTRPVIPPSVSLGMGTYPKVEEVARKLKEHGGQVVTLDPFELAARAGSTLAANMVMLGALAGTGRLPLRVEALKRSIAERFKGKVAEINLKAFDLGYEQVRKALSA